MSLSASLAQEDTCRACNCQFSNMEVLDMLIKSKIRNMLANDIESIQLIQDTIKATLTENTTLTQAIETRITYTVKTNLAYWIPIGLTNLGSHYLDLATTYSYSISGHLPVTATEFLVYSEVFCSTPSFGRSDNLAFYVQEGGINYYKYMYVTYGPSNITINSENMWFPVQSNQLIYTYNVHRHRPGMFYIYVCHRIPLGFLKKL